MLLCIFFSDCCGVDVRRVTFKEELNTAESDPLNSSSIYGEMRVVIFSFDLSTLIVGG